MAHTWQDTNKPPSFRSGPYLDKLLGPGGRVDAHLQRQICERIKKAREGADFTQEEMADLLEMTERGYQNYESVRVPFKKLGRIAQLTNVTEEWLLFGDRVELPEGVPDPQLLEQAAASTRLLTVIANEVKEMHAALLRIEQAMRGPGPEQREVGR